MEDEWELDNKEGGDENLSRESHIFKDPLELQRTGEGVSLKQG